MTELREKIAREIEVFYGASCDVLADRILAVPEIAEALRVKAIVDEAVRRELGGK